MPSTTSDRSETPRLAASTLSCRWRSSGKSRIRKSAISYVYQYKFRVRTMLAAYTMRNVVSVVYRRSPTPKGGDVYDVLFRLGLLCLAAGGALHLRDMLRRKP